MEYAFDYKGETDLIEKAKENLGLKALFLDEKGIKAMPERKTVREPIGKLTRTFYENIIEATGGKFDITSRKEMADTVKEAYRKTGKYAKFAEHIVNGRNESDIKRHYEGAKKLAEDGTDYKEKEILDYDAPFKDIDTEEYENPLFKGLSQMTGLILPYK